MNIWSTTLHHHPFDNLGYLSSPPPKVLSSCLVRYHLMKICKDGLPTSGLYSPSTILNPTWGSSFCVRRWLMIMLLYVLHMLSFVSNFWIRWLEPERGSISSERFEPPGLLWYFSWFSFALGCFLVYIFWKNTLWIRILATWVIYSNSTG